MIYFLTPYFLDDIGEAYNSHILNKYEPEDWICIRDMDTIILNNRIPKKLYEYIEEYPDTGIFTCYTNRIGGYGTQSYNFKTLQGEKITKNGDIKIHKKITDKLINEINSVELINKPISGFFMLFKYSTFKKVGGFLNGIFVDGKFSEKVLKAGYKIRLMKNIYVFHYYRLLEGINSKEHLKCKESKEKP